MQRCGCQPHCSVCEGATEDADSAQLLIFIKQNASRDIVSVIVFVFDAEHMRWIFRFALVNITIAF